MSVSSYCDRDDHSSPDDEWRALWTTLLLCAILCLVLLALHEACVRVPALRRGIFETRLPFLTPKRAPPARGGGLFAWLWAVSSVPDPGDDVSCPVEDNALLHLVGMDSYFYLHYLKMNVRHTSFTALMGCAALLPLYRSVGDVHSGNEFESWTMANLRGAEIEKDDGDWWKRDANAAFWVPVIFSGLFTAHALYQLRREYQLYGRTHRYFAVYGGSGAHPQTALSVQIEGVPPALRTNGMLKRHLDVITGGAVHSAHMVIRSFLLRRLYTHCELVSSLMEESAARDALQSAGASANVSADLTHVPLAPTPQGEATLRADPSLQGALIRSGASARSALLSFALRASGRGSCCGARGVDARRWRAAVLERLNAMRLAHLQRAEALACGATFQGAVEEGKDYSVFHLPLSPYHTMSDSGADDMLADAPGVLGGVHRRGPLLARAEARLAKWRRRAAASARGGGGGICSRCSYMLLRELSELLFHICRAAILAVKALLSAALSCAPLEGDAMAVTSTAFVTFSSYAAKEKAKHLLLGGTRLPHLPQDSGPPAAEGAAGERPDSPSRRVLAYADAVELSSAPGPLATAMLATAPLRMDVYDAPEPRDVLWGNAWLSREASDLRSGLARSVFALCAVGISVPMGAFANSGRVLEGLGVRPDCDNTLSAVAYALAIDNLPSVLFLSVLTALPLVFELSSYYFERLKSRVRVQESVFTRYFFFNLAYIYVSVFSVAIATAIVDVLRNPGSYLNLIGSALPGSATFFLKILFFKGLVLPAMELSRLCALLLRGLHRLLLPRPLGPRRREAAERPDYMGYGFEFASVFVAQIACSIFEVLCPIVSFVGAAGFYFTYVVQKHQAMYVFVPRSEGGGAFFREAFRRSITSIVAGQFVVIAQLALRLAYKPLLLMLCFPAVTIYVGYQLSSNLDVSSKVTFEHAVHGDHIGAKIKLDDELYLQEDMRAKEPIGPKPRGAGGP